MVQSLLQVSIGTIDIKMIRSLGVDAISAVGTGRNIIMLFNNYRLSEPLHGVTISLSKRDIRNILLL